MKHWTFKDSSFSEYDSCKEASSREEAIEEAFAELKYLNDGELADDDHIYVAECEARLPEMYLPSIEQMLDDYVGTNDTELPDDFTDPLYENYRVKPELAVELYQQIEEAQKKIQAAFLAWMQKHCGLVHYVGKEEVVHWGDVKETLHGKL